MFIIKLPHSMCQVCYQPLKVGDEAEPMGPRTIEVGYRHAKCTQDDGDVEE